MPPSRLFPKRSQYPSFRVVLINTCLILIAIWVNENGAILVDELEDGFFYHDYKAVIHSLVDACEKNRVQMFASSHSYEFLQAVVPSMTDREDSFRVLRFSNENGVTHVKTVEGKYYKSAIEQDFEIR